jgi:ATP-binding cassette subfamily F protein 3
LLSELETALADPGIYDTDARARLQELLQKQETLRGQMDAAEAAWLEASEALEAASAS